MAQSKDIRQFRAGQYAADGLSYDAARVLLKAEFGRGIRKTDYLQFKRIASNKPKKTTARTKPTTTRTVRKEPLTKPTDKIPSIKDAPRLATEAPQIRQALSGVSRLRSEKWRRYFYADVRFLEAVETKKHKKRTRFMSVFLGTFTPHEFRVAVNNGQVGKRIEQVLTAYVGAVPPYTVEGFWVTKQREAVN